MLLGRLVKFRIERSTFHIVHANDFRSRCLVCVEPVRTSVPDCYAWIYWAATLGAVSITTYNEHHVTQVSILCQLPLGKQGFGVPIHVIMQRENGLCVLPLAICYLLFAARRLLNS